MSLCDSRETFRRSCFKCRINPIERKTYKGTVERIKALNEDLRRSFDCLLGFAALTLAGRYIPDDIPIRNREKWFKLRQRELAIMVE